MPTLWITYAWDDNNSKDIDFIAQELTTAGLTIQLDRWNIQAGSRLWEQIERFIQDSGQSDAWMIVATQASLGSEACKEEFAYALDRALNGRGNQFPIIGLFPSTVNKSLIPAGLRTRLYVSITDPDWKERIVAATEGRTVAINRPQIEPYHIAIHKSTMMNVKYVIEVRPRAGTWSPFIAAIPESEHEKVKLDFGPIWCGPAGRPETDSIVLFGGGQGRTGGWLHFTAQNEATPTMSYYIMCSEIPSKLLFGVNGGMQHTITFNNPV